jgi:hypothetical protein
MLAKDVPSLENVRTARALFEGLARKYHGEYDGWEAAVQKYCSRERKEHSASHKT